MPKHEVAWYLNDQNSWEKVSFRELARAERRAELRERELREERDGTMELGVRNHPQTPHFFERRRIRIEIEPGERESHDHEERRGMLLNFLGKYDKYDFGYYERPWDEEDRGYESLLRLKEKYEWDGEVPFGLVYGKFVRFDVFGRLKDKLQLTDKCPFIAVEIVDTHFHSQEAFKALLETTRNIPLIIAYYFVPAAPRVNSVHKPKSCNEFSRIRLQCYIADGSFWFRNNRAEETEGVTTDNPVAYYNFIREKLYNEEFIRRKKS